MHSVGPAATGIAVVVLMIFPATYSRLRAAMRAVAQERRRWQ